MKKAGIRYACAGMLLMGVILTGIVCGVDAVEGSRQEAVACAAGDGREGAEAAVALTPAECALLARLVSAECQGEPYLCRVAAAAVVLNRTADERFPDSVTDVIFSLGAFPSVEEGVLGKEGSDEDLQVSLEAVRQAAAGGDPTGGALRFAREDTPRAQTIQVTFRAGEMVFGW